MAHPHVHWWSLCDVVGRRSHGGAGNYDKIAETLGAAGVPVVSVALGQAAAADGAATEPPPALPPLLIALCMLRVLRRRNHTGALLLCSCASVHLRGVHLRPRAA